MKRTLLILVILIAVLCTALLFSRHASKSSINVTVYGKSDTGFSWVRNYTGDAHIQDDFVSVLEESYVRLAESMDAGSSLKIFVQGQLVIECEHEGSRNSPFSGIQMMVHDRFASQYNFTTRDALPGNASAMEVLVEPFICGNAL